MNIPLSFFTVMELNDYVAVQFGVLKVRFDPFVTFLGRGQGWNGSM